MLYNWYDFHHGHFHSREQTSCAYQHYMSFMKLCAKCSYIPGLLFTFGVYFACMECTRSFSISLGSEILFCIGLFEYANLPPIYVEIGSKNIFYVKNNGVVF